jgi:hypothetical protein
MSYLDDALDRVVAMQKEAMASITSGKFDAKPYWPWFQNDFPYMTNRHGAMTVDYTKYAPDIEDNPETIAMRLVVGHVEEGYKGEVNARAIDYYIALRDYFRTHSNLITDGTTYGDYTSYPDYLDPDTGAYIVNHTGLVVFANTGLPSQQIGYELILAIPFMQSVY